MSPSDYLAKAIDIIEQNAYYQPRVTHWDTLVSESLYKASLMNSTEETYSLIWDLLRALEDRHSGLLIPSQKVDAKVKQQKLPEGSQLGNLGYIKLPEASGDAAAMQAYIDAGQLIIEKQASAYGWIVDLRENNGGNMWAMLPSIGAIVGERIYGYFVNRERELFHWGYKDGASFYENDIVYTANNPAQLVSDDYPLAVLVSNSTASSGEITLIACLSHPRVRVFGNPTAGIPTANDLFKLDENTTLVLTSFVTLDTRGNVHETSIIPDVVCTNPLVMAQKWLEAITYRN